MNTTTLKQDASKVANAEYKGAIDAHLLRMRAQDKHGMQAFENQLAKARTHRYN